MAELCAPDVSIYENYRPDESWLPLLGNRYLYLFEVGSWSGVALGVRFML